MVAISLQEFLLTGVLGPVHLGMTREQVRHALGEPDALGGTSRKYRTPTIWKYGTIELLYHPGNPHLQTIYMDGFEVPNGGSRMQLDSWVIRGGLSVEEVEAALAAAAIDYTRRPWRTTSEGILLVTLAGVEMGFLLEEEAYSPSPGLFFILKSMRVPNQVAQ